MCRCGEATRTQQNGMSDRAGESGGGNGEEAGVQLAPRERSGSKESPSASRPQPAGSSIPRITPVFSPVNPPRVDHHDLSSLALQRATHPAIFPVDSSVPIVDARGSADSPFHHKKLPTQLSPAPLCCSTLERRSLLLPFQPFLLIPILRILPLLLYDRPRVRPHYSSPFPSTV